MPTFIEECAHHTVLIFQTIELTAYGRYAVINLQVQFQIHLLFDKY